jgi:ubiquinone/menaquinone biosynthesis C-methylase UbiE
MTESSNEHAARIRDQFTKQAEPFAAFRIHTQEESLAWLRDELRLDPASRVLDAGCGPGLVASYLAPFARAVTGLDATPAMLAKARELVAARGLANVAFEEGVMERLPFEASSFDGVVTRYTLHHVLDASAVMAELVRVCRPGGRVVICDAAPRPERRAAYDAWERIRDPSHTSARTPEELRALFDGALGDVSVRGFRLESEVEALVQSSFPAPGGREALLEQMRADVGVDALDMNARIVDGRLLMSFPIVIVAGTVAG